MPHKPTISDIQLNSIITCVNAVLPLLNDLHDGLGTPFMHAISNTTLNLLPAVQVTEEKCENNKDECVHLMKDIHQILFAIAKLHMKSEPQGSLPPSTLDHIGKFTNTLHKIHTFVEGQQEKSRFKHFLRQSEMRILFKECQAGLQQALESFKIETGAAILADTLKMQGKTEKLHEELLDLILNMTEGSSDRTSSVPESLAAPSCQLIMFESSISFGLLPAKPKIFHGRESELHKILQNFSNEEAPRVAILGTGGIGKTSLAKAALHYPGISANYETKLFVACDSATTSIELAALVGFICALYCLLRLPETSSAQGMIRSTKTGRPSATSRIGWGLNGTKSVRVSGRKRGRENYSGDLRRVLELDATLIETRALPILG
ncbi:hypothetical protein FB451DRAFT_1190177 [Mycena latifolia]|nr:hypothetical protein FB451DRAFT_1190177 [Mycena latifolia]